MDRTGTLRGRQLLVVEDDFDSRELFVALLEAEGATVIATASAHEAIALLSRFQPEVLLCDLLMPTMDGWSLLEQIRSHTDRALRSIPAIAVTVLCEWQFQPRTCAVGFADYLVKPVAAEQLVQAVLRVLPQQIISGN